MLNQTVKPTPIELIFKDIIVEGMGLVLNRTVIPTPIEPKLKDILLKGMRSILDGLDYLSMAHDGNPV